ncbi:MAG: hypothetical protein QOJ65_1872, partial [Fimbriimonadaceae bacterium]|nr:hypothetical protein [Fimbriimonadaceae bacterium]
MAADPATAPAEMPEEYPSFDQVTSDPQWATLKPSEKTGVVDRWTEGLRQYSAQHKDWDQAANNKAIDEESAKLRFNVLDNHLAGWETNLHELGQSFADSALKFVEAVPRALASYGETPVQAKQRLDELIAKEKANITKDQDAGLVDLTDPNSTAKRSGFLNLLQAKRDAIDSGKDPYYDPVHQAGQKMFQTEMRGYADYIQALREKLPEGESTKTNPAYQDTLLAKVSRGVGKLISMVNPAAPAVLAGTTYTEGADAAIKEARAKGETDPDKLTDIGNAAGLELIAKSIPQLAAYTLAGPLASKAAAWLAPTAGPIVKGVVGGTTAAGANLTVSGAARVYDKEQAKAQVDADTTLTPEQRTAAKAEIDRRPGFIGDAEQNTMDVGFGTLGGVHAYQHEVHFQQRKTAAIGHLESLDGVEGISAGQAQAAKDKFLADNFPDETERTRVRAEYEATKAKVPVDAAVEELKTADPTSEAAPVAETHAAEDEQVAVDAELARAAAATRLEIAQAETARLQAAEDKKLADEKAAKEAEKPAPESEPAPEPKPTDVAQPTMITHQMESDLKALGIT